jgi:predicted MFS family arabinose efflux permease
LSRGEQPATFGEVFAVGEFRALFTAQILSIAGDQLARVALALLVFDRTGSAALTALTYALTFLPDIIGGPLLSGLADRYRRRELMVITDLARVLLVGLMAIPGMHIAALAALLIAVQLLASPFNAARAAVLPSILEGDRFVVGQGIVNITYQLAQLAGYVTGGVIVKFTGTSVSLLVDALTFLVSAILVRLGLRDRPVPESASLGGQRQTTMRSLREGARLVWQDRKLRVLVTLGCISGFYIVPEALAVPYGAELGGGAVIVGLLFAAPAAGTVVGMLILTRLVPPATRTSLLGILSVASSAVLVGCVTRPGLAVTIVLFALSGAAAAHQTVVAANFVQAVPDAQRGQAFGLAHTSIRVAQGLGAVLAGAVAEGLAPSMVVATAGALGTLAALAAAITWYRVRTIGISPVDLAH